MPSHTYVFLADTVYTLDTHAERVLARSHMAEEPRVPALPIWQGGPEEANNLTGEDFTLECPMCGLEDGWEPDALEDGSTICECARCFVCQGYPTHEAGCAQWAWPFDLVSSYTGKVTDVPAPPGILPAEHAIVRSVKRNSEVEVIDFTPEDAAELRLVIADDNGTETAFPDRLEFEGMWEGGFEWRVHLVLAPGTP
jgi:hypothetical protein